MSRVASFLRSHAPLREGMKFSWLLVLATLACAPSEPAFVLSELLERDAQLATEADETAPPAAAEHLEVGPPPFSEGVFPCTDCHDPDIPVKGTRRTLKRAHQELELRHAEEGRWCGDCHDFTDFDQLHLASGEGVPFEESYRLCGQCHGDKYRDWRVGIHGRRSGMWNGAKTYLLCVNCHNSHDPAFQPLQPKPAPKAPERTR